MDPVLGCADVAVSVGRWPQWMTEAGLSVDPRDKPEDDNRMSAMTVTDLLLPVFVQVGLTFFIMF